MKYFKITLSLLLFIVTFYVLNTKIGNIPPIGKFLNPSQGFWQNEENESVTGEIQIEGLSDNVIVHYDEQLIPHIFAQNKTDLYKAQGYITAKHRLWQMEFQTYAAAGRISEIIGKDGLNHDRQKRRRGMVFGAENSIEKMKSDPQTLSYLHAYKDGVNSYIQQLNLPTIL